MFRVLIMAIYTKNNADSVILLSATRCYQQYGAIKCYQMLYEKRRCVSGSTCLHIMLLLLDDDFGSSRYKVHNIYL